MSCKITSVQNNGMFVYRTETLENALDLAKSFLEISEDSYPGVTQIKVYNDLDIVVWSYEVKKQKYE